MLLELAMGFEISIEHNSKMKREKYKALVDRLTNSYREVVYVKISMAACGFIENDSKKLFEIIKKLKLSHAYIRYLS